MTDLLLPEIPEFLDSAEPSAILRHVLQRWPTTTALGCSFGGPSGMVLLDLAMRVDPRIPVFCLDTGFLFPQTHDLIARVSARYGIEVQRVRPSLSPEQQAQAYGENLWGRDPHLCCRLRKVEPMRRALQGLDAWITGVRRDQSPTRRDTRVMAWDDAAQVMKVAPLAAWTEAQVWDYVRRFDVPYNALHDENFPSIGCTHCTRAVAPNEHMRAGRWSGFEKTECGLHREEPRK